MPNSIDYASIFQSALDKQMIDVLTSAKMEANASQIKYNGGNTVEILKMTLEGLGTYSRSTGFPAGDITTEWESFTFDMDRGKEFSLDRMDNDEQFVDIAGMVLSEFQRNYVVPEVDAYRYSSVYTTAAAASKTASYTPVVGTIFSQLKTEIATVQDIIGESEPLSVYMNYATSAILDQADDISHELDLNSNNGQAQTKIRSLDGIPIIKVPSARFWSAYDFSATDGFSPATGALAMNWIICADKAALGVVKTDKPRIFAPDVNQEADAWKIQYRKYHTMIMPDNKVDGVFISYTPA